MRENVALSEICPEAQALIDRLARMDPADPCQDTATIERAITAHLAVLGMHARRFAWAEDARNGYRQADAAWMSKDNPTPPAGSRDARDSAWTAAFEVVDDEAWNAASEQGLEYEWEYACAVGREAAHRAARGDAWNTASNAVGDRSWRTIGDAAWDAINSAVGPVNGLAAFGHSATVRLAELWRPMFDAFEAGLFRYWIMPDEVICVLQPALRTENGHLHCSDGPAIVWPSGEAYHFWHGMQVPA